MTRKEVYDAAEKYFKETYVEDEASYVIDAFIKGAEWSMDNPNWHKYPDEKPQKRKDSNWSKATIIAVKGIDLPIKGKLYYASKVMPIEYWYSTELNCRLDKEYVLAWMELPKPPKFD